MNKNVIYIEPEDDITDIISKIETSKEKIVALVPPKKAGVFRSVVNIKLIAKAGINSEKKIVLVTTDPSIIKLAATTKIPVTKNLQSVPAIPEIDEKPETVSEEDIVEENEDEDKEEEKEEKAEETKDEENKEDEDDEEEEGEEEEEEEKKSEKKKDAKKPIKSKNKVIDWIKEHKKLSIFCGIFAVILILVLIWMFAIAPAVDVMVYIKTTQNNFSKTVTFTTNVSEENVDEGKFYLEEKKIETTQEVKFDATGKKNVGEKAHGDVVVYAYIGRDGGTIPINAGTVFSISGLSFSADEAAKLSWDGKDIKDCENSGQVSIMSGCLISARVKVTATGAGEKYNIAASNSGWSAVVNIDGVYSDKAMSGGTDSLVTVVQQSDVEKAKGELSAEKESENKEKLYETIEDDEMIIESSFSQTTSTAESTPKVDEEVKEGEQAVLKATTVTKVYVIDKVKVEEYIKAKVELNDNQKIYEIRDEFLESFVESNNTFTAKLKAQYFVGPKITESEVVEKIKGKGLGDASREIRDIDGVSDVKMSPSFPWVMAVPGDSNKITVSFDIKDQNGQPIEEKKEEEKKSDEKTEKNEKKETEKEDKS